MTDSAQQYGIRFTIPDLPANKQLEMVRDLKKTMQTFADIANEPLDTKTFDDIIAKLEAKLKDGDLTPLEQTKEK